jgi:hypothetical protein
MRRNTQTMALQRQRAVVYLEPRWRRWGRADVRTTRILSFLTYNHANRKTIRASTPASPKEMVRTRSGADTSRAQPSMTAAQLPRLRRPGAGRPRTAGRECQDYPPWEALAHASRRTFPAMRRDANRDPTQQCELPPQRGVRLRRCEGWRFGYDAAQDEDHGRDFLVCEHCARRNWQTYNWSQDPYAVDLCRNCSVRPPHNVFFYDGRIECVCQFDCHDKKVHLCTDCKIEQRSRECSRVLERIKAETQLEHMHSGDDDDCDWEDCTNIEHFIQPHGNGPRGESGCLCGLDDVQKLVTYLGGRNSEANLRDMVRFCVHCWRETFVAMRPD